MKDLAMTFDEIWAQLERKRPALTNPGKTVEITAANFKALARQIYEQGQKQGAETASLPPAYPSADAYKSLFGGL